MVPYDSAGNYYNDRPTTHCIVCGKKLQSSNEFDKCNDCAFGIIDNKVGDVSYVDRGKMTSKEKIEKAWELVNSKHIETNEEIQLVRFAVGMARELVERDTPKKVEMGTSKHFKFPICPNCKTELNEYYKYANKFCKECGQRLDWSE